MKNRDETPLSRDEVDQRREAALKKMLSTPPVKHADQKSSPRKDSSRRPKASETGKAK